MQIFIDSASVGHIKQLTEQFPIDGVTTNPTIIIKEQKPFIPLLKEIRTVIGEDKTLFAQVIEEDSEGIVKEALAINEELEGNICVKIPVTTEGIQAIKQLKPYKIKMLATTIYTPMQAYLAAKAGADYVAPYVNRIDNLTGDGVRVVSEIVKIFDMHQYSCKVLAASFKNIQQIQQVCLAGAHGITAAPDLLDKINIHPSTKADVREFAVSWKESYSN